MNQYFLTPVISSVLKFLVMGTTVSLLLLGQVTSDLTDPRLGVHASLPQHNPPGAKLSQMLVNARALASSKGVLTWKGLDIVASDHEVLPMSMPLTSALQLAYQKQVCAADAIIVGHITSSLYHLSAAGTGVYGDYIVVIDRLLKDNRAASIHSKADIVVTRPGGSLLLAEGPVNFDMQGFPRFESGATYLQFLRYIPQSGGYQAINELSTLVARGANWFIARKNFNQLVMPEFTRDALEDTIIKWVASCK
jgi:hypothetical protein